MTIRARHFCLAILVAVALGHESLAVHATMHGLDDSPGCQLCNAYGGGLGAIPAGHEHHVPGVAIDFLRTLPVAPPPTLASVPFHQRGPPYPG